MTTNSDLGDGFSDKTDKGMRSKLSEIPAIGFGMPKYCLKVVICKL